jgi:hypothetical protein
MIEQVSEPLLTIDKEEMLEEIEVFDSIDLTFFVLVTVVGAALLFAVTGSSFFVSDSEFCLTFLMLFLALLFASI